MREMGENYIRPQRYILCSDTLTYYKWMNRESCLKREWQQWHFLQQRMGGDSQFNNAQQKFGVLSDVRKPNFKNDLTLQMKEGKYEKNTDGNEIFTNFSHRLQTTSTAREHLFNLQYDVHHFSLHKAIKAFTQGPTQPHQKGNLKHGDESVLFCMGHKYTGISKCQ